MKSWFESWVRESRNKQIPVVEGGRQLRDVLWCVITLCMVLKWASVHCLLLRLPFQGAYTVLEKRTHYKLTDSSEHPPTTPVSHLSVSVYLPNSKYLHHSEYCLLLFRGDRRTPQLLYCHPKCFYHFQSLPLDLASQRMCGPCLEGDILCPPSPFPPTSPRQDFILPHC